MLPTVIQPDDVPTPVVPESLPVAEAPDMAVQARGEAQRRPTWTSVRSSLKRPLRQPPIDGRAGLDTTPGSEVCAYAEGCLVSGNLDAGGGDRPSDFIAASSTLALRNARAVALEDGRTYDLGDLTFHRDEVIAIQVAGRQGDPRRRRRTVRQRVVIRARSYRISGDLHAVPGADPIAMARQRGTTLAVTDAQIRYLRQGVLVEDYVPFMVVSLGLADSIVDADHRSWDAHQEFDSPISA